MENTLVLIKPDAVKRRLIGQILYEYERNGLEVIKMRMLLPSLAKAEKHYAVHSDKPFYGTLLNYITSGQVVAVLLQGEDAVQRVRKINGATDPRQAAENTIRYLYGINKTENAVHASDSLENAGKEDVIWFD